MPVAIAIAGAAVVGAGASISASNKAAKTAKTVAASNNALATSQFNDNKAALAPYQAQGTLATGTINGLLGIGGDAAASARAFDTYKGSTEYTSRLAEGNAGVNAALGASSLRDSGAAVKAAAKFNQQFASNEFGAYLGNLQGQQALGLSAASAQAGVSQGYVSNVTGNNNNAANTSANAALSNASSINGALGGLVSAYGYSQGALGSSYGGAGAAGRAPYGGNLGGIY